MSIMKYIKLVASVTLFSLLLSSCSDFLEVENYEGIPADEFITSVNNEYIIIHALPHKSLNSVRHWVT